MKSSIPLYLILIAFTCDVGQLNAQQPLQPIDWLRGPVDAQLDEMATVPIPEGFLFADAINARRFLEACQIRTTGLELAIIRPLDENSDWYVVFEFSDDGYVKDDQAKTLDPAATLKVLQEINDEENVERQRLGWSSTRVVDWELPPQYDPESNNLEWAIRVERDGLTDINYNTRTLGRFGVMIVNLVVGPEDLPTAMPAYRSLIDAFQYSDGHRYAEFRQGDQVARYGLTALITGTAATMVLKTGLLRRLLAPLCVALLALLAAIRRRFGKGVRVNGSAKREGGTSDKPISP